MNTRTVQDLRIPVTVITGFLGAGKTTLLNHWVKQPAMRDAAILINEFGEVAIDHLLVDQFDDDMVLLESGCLCCTVRGDLSRALRELFMRRLNRRIGALSRVLIETTGLADPAPVIHTLQKDFFIAERYRLEGVVTAVSATHVGKQLSRHFEAVKQVAMADRLLITKCDLVSEPAMVAVGRLLKRLNPGAPQIPVHHGQAAVDALLHCGGYDANTKSAEVRQWLAASAADDGHEQGHDHDHDHDHDHEHEHDANRHDASVRAQVVRFSEPVVWREFATLLDTLLARVGDRVLRIKGFVNVVAESAPRVIHCVQHTRYPETTLAKWPDDDHHSRLVIIARNLDPQLLLCEFQALGAVTVTS